MKTRRSLSEILPLLGFLLSASTFAGNGVERGGPPPADPSDPKFHIVCQSEGPMAAVTNVSVQAVPSGAMGTVELAAKVKNATLGIDLAEEVILVEKQETLTYLDQGSKGRNFKLTVQKKAPCAGTLILPKEFVMDVYCRLGVNL